MNSTPLCFSLLFSQVMKFIIQWMLCMFCIFLLLLFGWEHEQAWKWNEQKAFNFLYFHSIFFLFRCCFCFCIIFRHRHITLSFVKLVLCSREWIKVVVWMFNENLSTNLNGKPINHQLFLCTFCIHGGILCVKQQQKM